MPDQILMFIINTISLLTCFFFWCIKCRDTTINVFFCARFYMVAGGMPYSHTFGFARQKAGSRATWKQMINTLTFRIDCFWFNLGFTWNLVVCWVLPHNFSTGFKIPRTSPFLCHITLSRGHALKLEIIAYIGHNILLNWILKHKLNHSKIWFNWDNKLKCTFQTQMKLCL